MNHMFSLFFMKATHRLYFFVINSFKYMYSGSGDFRLGCVLYFKCDSKYFFYFIQENIVRLRDFYSDNPFDLCQSFALGRNMVIFQNKMSFHITNFLFYMFLYYFLCSPVQCDPQTWSWTHGWAPLTCVSVSVKSSPEFSSFIAPFCFVQFSVCIFFSHVGCLTVM